MCARVTKLTKTVSTRVEMTFFFVKSIYMLISNLIGCLRNDKTCSPGGTVQSPKTQKSGLVWRAWQAGGAEEERPFVAFG